MSMALGPGGAAEHNGGHGTRVFEHARIWRLDRSAFDAAARMLAAAGPPPALVVRIARGAVELARFLGDWFGVPVATVTVSSRPSARWGCAFPPGTGRKAVCASAGPA
jgi:hypothetical protein